MIRSRCRHCGHRIGRGTRRQLCWACYRNLDVRAAYKRLAPGPKLDPDREPDAHELDEIIAAQMRRLPDWWTAECERERGSRPKVFALVKCT